MKIKPSMYKEVVERFLNWRVEGDMPAAVGIYKEIIKTVGAVKFAEWARVGFDRGELSLYMLNKIKTHEDRANDLGGLETTEKRVKFLEDNCEAFVSFIHERYVPFVLPLEEIVAMIKSKHKTDDCNHILDSVMIKILKEMGAYYRHYVFILLDRSDTCEPKKHVAEGA